MGSKNICYPKNITVSKVGEGVVVVAEVAVVVDMVVVAEVVVVVDVLE